MSFTSITVNTITEKTVDNGVLIEGILHKDSNISSLGTINTDIINENSLNTGVTIEGVLFRDSTIFQGTLELSTSLLTDTINEKTLDSGVTIESVLLKDGNVEPSISLKTDTITERTTDSGVTIEGILLKDGNIELGNIVYITGIYTGTIGPRTLGAGVDIDNTNINNGTITAINTITGVVTTDTISPKTVTDITIGNITVDGTELTTTGKITTGLIDVNNSIQTDYIYERTSGAGVIIDIDVLIKDGNITCDRLIASNISGVVGSDRFARLATTENITLSGLQTIDGILTDPNDRVLVKDQTDKKENGVYLTNAAAWTRTVDMDIGADFASARFIVEEGLANADSMFICINDPPITLGTSDIEILCTYQPPHASIYEPSGFPDYTEIDVTFNDVNRRVTITPTGTSYTFCIDGKKNVKDSAGTYDIPDTTGMHFIYYDDTANLTSVINPTESQIKDLYVKYINICNVYWNSTYSTQYYFTGNNTISGSNLDGDTGYFLHRVVGARVIEGGELNTILADENGSLNSHTQFGINQGTMIKNERSITRSAISVGATIVIVYRVGPIGSWAGTTNPPFPILTTGTGRAAYNEWTGATWQLTEVPDDEFVLYHVITHADSNNSYWSIVGQNTYSTLSAARIGATTEINDIATNYVNGVKSRIRSTDTGEDYLDMRYKFISPNTPLDIHGNISGLGQDDHTQYALLSGRSGDVLKIDAIAEYTGAAGLTIDDVLKVDSIVEKTTDAGVLIEGSTLEDGNIISDSLNTDSISEKTGSAGITVNHQVKVDQLVEKTTDTGVTVENMTIEDDGVDTIINIPTGKKYIFKINNVTVAEIS
jgi:hypothetical protein